jgi:hypothetical protein
MIIAKIYKQMPGYVELTLGCTCERPQVVEETIGKAKTYVCRGCQSVATLERLRNESSAQWHNQHWLVHVEKRREQRHEVDLAVKIRIKSVKDQTELPLLVGKAHNISATGLSVSVNNLTREFLLLYKTTICEAEVKLPARLSEFLPRSLRARIVYVDYKEDALPQGIVGLSFIKVSQADRDHLGSYLRMLQE